MIQNKKTVEPRKNRLSSLKINKKVIESPIKRLEKLHLQSWAHHGVCDVLWAALIRSNFDQEQSLNIFRDVISNIMKNPDRYASTLLTHSTLAELPEVDFDHLFMQLIKNKSLNKILSPLLLIDCLPDRHHWIRHLQAEDQEQSWSLLADAVGTIFNHQSQEATDVRWLKPMSLIATKRSHYPEHLREIRDNIIQYPILGDMRSVRPSIRANEGAVRGHEEMNGKGGISWAEIFWSECWEKTNCIMIDPDDHAQMIDGKNVVEQIYRLGQELQIHFIETLKTTSVDARHDGTFGIMFYLMQLTTYCILSRSSQTVAARLILRTALEYYITLAFLCKKDDATIWLQFRNYGSGQARLSFLKMSDQDEEVSFISRETIESLASEDFWHEYLDIKLGSWSNKNLREMAIEAGVKSIYDRYYDALSGYVHGNWSSILHASFGLCGNPLHRFHRIPHPPRIFKDDATPDLVKILNLSLDLITSLYSPFKPRIRIR